MVLPHEKIHSTSTVGHTWGGKNVMLGEVRPYWGIATIRIHNHPLLQVTVVDHNSQTKSSWGSKKNSSNIIVLVLDCRVDSLRGRKKLMERLHIQVVAEQQVECHVHILDKLWMGFCPSQSRNE